MGPSAAVRCSTPAGRLLGGALLSIGIARSSANPPRLAAAAAIAGVALLLLRPALGPLLKRSAAALAAATLALVPLALDGRAAHAGWLLARAGLAVLVALTFSAAIGPLELGGALSGLRLPNSLVRVTTGLLSQLSELKEAGQRILLARRLRGAPGTSLTPDVLVSLLLRARARALQVELARALRGYDPARHARGLARRDAWLLVPAGLATLWLGWP